MHPGLGFAIIISLPSDTQHMNIVQKNIYNNMPRIAKPAIWMNMPIMNIDKEPMPAKAINI